VIPRLCPSGTRKSIGPSHVGPLPQLALAATWLIVAACMAGYDRVRMRVCVCEFGAPPSGATCRSAQGVGELINAFAYGMGCGGYRRGCDRVGWFGGFGVDPAIPTWLRAKAFVKDKKSAAHPATVLN
jgi:hypothetical protein